MPDAARLASRQEQFEALIARHRGIVFKVAHAYCRDPEDRHDYREMAEILGITETNVATRLSRLRQRLRDELVDDPTRQENRRGTR